MGRPQSSGKRPAGSGAVAKLRLEQTLDSDFLECDPQQAALMKKEILEILSRYMNVKKVQQIRLDIIREQVRGVRYVKTIQIKGL